jgi:RNA polymerase sigma-70 factor (ECF subfamily)
LRKLEERTAPIPIDLETVTEARLVSQALAGSQPAVEHIVRRYQAPVIRLISRIVGDPALAEDLAQETFVKTFRSLEAFDPTRRLSSWIFRIAHNTALDALRRVKVPFVALDPRRPADEPAAPPVADPVEQGALRAALDAALGGVRPEYRAVIGLRYEEGLSFDEISQALGIPEATARSHVHRARKELLRALTEAGWNPDAPLQRAAPRVRKP